MAPMGKFAIEALELPSTNLIVVPALLPFHDVEF